MASVTPGMVQNVKVLTVPRSAGLRPVRRGGQAGSG
jgi:hypothetical protein